MCGICGFTGERDDAALAAMMRRLSHRGPDGDGLLHDPALGVSLGHRRLAVVDLAGGSQPMETADGRLAVVFNGEIYNHAALRRELTGRGHRFETHHSDTEVLLHGWREWGEELPKRLNGMWAFALMDRERRSLFLSRDRFGEKPLFYTARPGFFAFASELSSLIVHPRVPAEISRKSIKKYFAYGYIPAPGSLYQGVQKLPAGANLLLELESLSSRISHHFTFSIDAPEDLPENAEEAWSRQIRDILSRSVAERLVADVPIGVFLSGGIDSSAVTAFAAKAKGDEPVRTFSIAFAEKSFDESAYARRTAGLFNTIHTEAACHMESARGIAPQVLSMLDEPMGDSSILPTWLLSRETRKSVTVALSGDGGDELFAGYDPFKALALADFYAKLVPKPLHRAILMVVSRLPVSHGYMSLDFKLKRTLTGLSHASRLWNPVWMGPLSPSELCDLFREPADPEEIYEEAISAWEAGGPKNIVDKTLEFFTRLYLADDILVKSDRAGMMHALEIRAPFLDKDLCELVRRIPWRVKLKNGRTKHILKKALEPVLPKDILHRRKKGFGVPVGDWFRRGLFQPGEIPGEAPGFTARALGDHMAGRRDHRLFLWNAYVLGFFT